MFLEPESSRKAISFIRDVLYKVRPGEWVEVDYCLFRDIWPKDYNGGHWNQMDRVLEGMIGSAYEWTYTVMPDSMRVLFKRRLDPAKERLWADPDRIR